MMRFLVIMLLLPFCALAAKEKDTNKKCPKLVNFGYNKFVVSPYSQTLAVTAFDSDQGSAIFESSEYKKAFFLLAPHYCPQQHINSCGIASAVMILNTVYANNGKTPPISRSGSWCVPEDKSLYGQFVWTEENFYNKNVKGIVDKDVLEGRKKVHGEYLAGIELDRLTRALNAQGLLATAFHVTSAEASDISNFRTLVKALLISPIAYMIVNYNLDLYTVQGGGHFSPIAAYDAASDTILILDTWSASNTWIWVKLVDLYKSMNTLDGTAYRGYILVNQI